MKAMNLGRKSLNFLTIDWIFLGLVTIFGILHNAVVNGQASTTAYPTRTDRDLDTTTAFWDPETTTTAFLMTPQIDSSWEDSVLAGPALAKYIGLFMVLLSKKNATLVYPNSGKFEHLNNGTSLGAALKDLSSKIELAFKKSEDDLERLRISVEQIPDHVKAGLHVIQSVPEASTKKMLPYIIRNMKRALNESSSVSKLGLERFTDVAKFIEELSGLVKPLNDSVLGLDFAFEVKEYTKDIQNHWSKMTNLFMDFRNRTDFMKVDIERRFIDVIQEAENDNAFGSPEQRNSYLQKLIPVTVFLDESSKFLDLVIGTHMKIVTDYVLNQLVSNNNYTTLTTDYQRAVAEQNLWKNMVQDAVKVARLTQQQHDAFVTTKSDRKLEYDQYLNTTLF